MSLRRYLIAVALSAIVNASPLAKQRIEWNACEELNRNISSLTSPPENFEPFECGKLTVPLDYTGCEEGTLDLALFRINATEGSALGTVLWNPGGPGGAAPPNMPSIASDFRAHVGAQWNLLSWDPRGVGNTIPFICPELEGAGSGGPASRKRDNEGTFVQGNSTEAILDEAFFEAGKLSASCFVSNSKIMPLVGTTFGARDMIEILDALDEDGMLRYYGNSYGTALGSYFAAMFPDRVERMVLDANVNPTEYRDGHMGDYYRDVDAALEGFLEACFDNKDQCTLVETVKANSTQDLVDAVNLMFQPFAVNASQSFESWLLDSRSRQGTTRQLYFPSQFPQLDLVLAELFTGSTAADAEVTAGEAWSYGQAKAAYQAIRGADATKRYDNSSAYLPIYDYQQDASSFASVDFEEFQIAQWPVRAREQFLGPFEAKTRHPILYVNGEYDPITPLDHARRAMKGFEGSKLVTHSGFGHTAFANPSSCVQKHVRAYFADGTLPDEETRCKPDLGPWELAQVRNGSIYGAIGDV